MSVNAVLFADEKQFVSRKGKSKMRISAHERGFQYGVGSKDENPVLVAMTANPFKTPKARADYIKGVSDGMNLVASIKTRNEIYG